MKRLLLLILLSIGFQQCVIAESLYGLEPAPPPMRANHLKHFFQLFEQFCLGQGSQQIANQNIVSSERFHPSKDYEGVFEEYFGRLSYAVTPDPDACTVDVLLEYEKGRLLLSLEDVQGEVARITNYRLKNTENKTEEWPNSEQVQTIEAIYHPKDSDEKAIVLTYPISEQDVFYMTLDYHYE